MSRTDKDLPYRLGGQRRKYYTSEKYHAWFTKNIRRRARAKAREDLKKGKEPAPRYPVESTYYD